MINVNRRYKLIDKSKIIKGLGSAGKAICDVVLSAFGINKDDRHDGSAGETGQGDSYPEELFEKYKYK